MKFKHILIISFAILVISFWNRNELPDKKDMDPQLAVEPIQQMIQLPEFSVNVDGNDYFI